MVVCWNVLESLEEKYPIKKFTGRGRAARCRARCQAMCQAKIFEFSDF